MEAKFNNLILIRYIIQFIKTCIKDNNISAEKFINILKIFFPELIKSKSSCIIVSTNFYNHNFEIIYQYMSKHKHIKKMHKRFLNLSKLSLKQPSNTYAEYCEIYKNTKNWH